MRFFRKEALARQRPQTPRKSHCTKTLASCIIEKVMFYERFLESVNRWPDSVVVQMQRQPGATVEELFPGTLHTAPDGHVNECYTFRQLQQMAESVGAWLQRQPLEKGARCAILAANSPRWMAVYTGIIGAGLAAVPLDTAFHADQVTKLLRDSGAKLLFCDERNYAVAAHAARECGAEMALIDGRMGSLPTFEQMLATGSAGFAPHPAKADDLACLLYTSGTTSDPKGVMLSQTSLVGEMDSVKSFIRIDTRDAIVGVLPLFHALAQMANLYFPLVFGMRVVYLDSLNTQELLYALREQRITLFCCVPQFFYLMHDKIMDEVERKGPVVKKIFQSMLRFNRISRKAGLNFGKILFGSVHRKIAPNMRYFVTGGSRFDAEVGKSFQDMGFRVLQAYGLSEVSGGCFCTPPAHNRMGSIGRPLPGVEAKLLNPKAPPDGGPAVGELLVRGKLLMAGYYKRPEATAEVLKDGWLHTGDLCYKDRRGNYFVTGRAKEVIVLASGKNLYPEEIESYYLKSPWIKEICVLGLESNKPGEPRGERLHAVVVPDFEQLRLKGAANARENIRYDIENISVHLPATKRILSYEVWQQDLPRTTTRKLRRFEIQKMVEQQRSQNETGEAPLVRQMKDEDLQWLAQPQVGVALDVLRAALKNPPSQIHPDDNLELDLALDSMERVELMVELEHKLGAVVEDTAASQVYTVREMVDMVISKIGSGKLQRAGWETILAEEQEDASLRAIVKHIFPLDFSWFLAVQFIKLGSRIGFKLKVTGREKLPDGACILCPNHASYLDGPILTSVLPWRVFRNIFFVGASDIFGSGPLGLLARFLRLIPVDPDANLVPAMRAEAYGLRRGRVLIVYPEGTRSIDGTVQEYRKGVAILAHHLQIPLVPVAQHGFYDVWPRNRGFQGWKQLQIAFGEPVYPRPDEAPEEAYERLTNETRQRVIEMWQELDKKK